jgi:hypothetical protein
MGGGIVETFGPIVAAADHHAVMNDDRPYRNFSFIGGTSGLSKGLGHPPLVGLWLEDRSEVVHLPDIG